MNNNIDKEQLRRRFLKYLPLYESQAVIQREIAKRLALDCDEFSDVLEIGCGTGFLTREIFLKESPVKYYLNDLVEQAVDGLEESLSKNYPSVKIQKLAGDIEQITLPENLNAVISASTLQWLTDFEVFSQKVSQSLERGGAFIFNTFGVDNLFQIKELTGRGLDYYETDELRKNLSKNFSQINIEEVYFNPILKNPLEVLRHLQQTGVTGTGDFKWTKTKLQKFEQEYLSRYTRDNGVELTWHVILVKCKK